MLQFFFSVAVAEEAVVANALEAVGQDMKQEAADEFVPGQGHGFLLAAVAIVLVAELHLAVFDGEQTIIGDGYAMGIAAHVIEDLLGAGKGGLSIIIAMRRSN